MFLVVKCGPLGNAVMGTYDDQRTAQRAAEAVPHLRDEVVFVTPAQEMRNRIIDNAPTVVVEGAAA